MKKVVLGSILLYAGVGGFIELMTSVSIRNVLNRSDVPRGLSLFMIEKDTIFVILFALLILVGVVLGIVGIVEEKINFMKFVIFGSVMLLCGVKGITGLMNTVSFVNFTVRGYDDRHFGVSQLMIEQELFFVILFASFILAGLVLGITGAYIKTKKQV